jgi:hypothetical protein
MEKLPLSIGILAWNSGQTLINTLTSYHYNGLFNVTDDIKLFFQEFNNNDKIIANHFNIDYIPSRTNIGIGNAFITLAESAKYENFLILEHDWKLNEDTKTTYNRLENSIKLLDRGINTIRFRHRKQPGFPHFSEKYVASNFNYFDPEIQTQSSHLLDSVHWVENPEIQFPNKIKKLDFLEEKYYIADSEVANWTNNPGLFKTKFFIDTLKPFTGQGIDLEGKISYWWARQNFEVAHGEGLFKHEDIEKYGK